VFQATLKFRKIALYNHNIV